MQDNFHKIIINQPSDTLIDIKEWLNSLNVKIHDITNENEKIQFQTSINNITEFIEFVENNSSTKIIYLDKTNEGPTSAGIGGILIRVGTSTEKLVEDPVRDEIRTEIYKQVTPQAQTSYFIHTRINQIYEWWETGETRDESFGTVHDDKFRGFIKINR